MTVCVKDRINYFGRVINGTMELSKTGEIAAQHWNNITVYYSNIELDEFVVMPNHVHGIIVIKNCDTENNGKSGGITGHYNPMTGNSLSRIIRWYKGRTAFEIHKLRGDGSFQWQSRFYDHIIRGEQSLGNIRKYIIDNPLKWAEDSEYRDDSNAV